MSHRIDDAPASARVLGHALFLGILFILLTAPPTHAASITSDGTMGTTVQDAGGHYTITDGTVTGNNQFHSFGIFNIFTGESAVFQGPASIENIIGRVTGGDPSFIDGLLATDIPGAALYLLNPSGVLFGPNASLDVQGSFHVSTADYLRFEDGGVFHADPSKSSVLSVANPAAFGFLGSSPATISVGNTDLVVPEGETLSLIGGDIQINGAWEDGDLEAPGGRINIASVASPGEVVPVAPAGAGSVPDLLMESFDDLGTISLLYYASIDAGGPGGGNVIIRGGRLYAFNASISASSKSDGACPNPGVDIEIREDVVLQNSSQVNSNIHYGVAADSGDIRIRAGGLEVDSFSQINSVAYGEWGGWPASSGKSGDIDIETRGLVVRNGGMIRAGTGGLGDGGDIRVRTETLEMRDAGVLYTPAFGGTGDAGAIDVEAKSIVFSNENYPGYATGMLSQASSPGTGDAGDIRVRTDSLEIAPGTEISTATWYTGKSGNIEIDVTGEASIRGTRDLNPWGDHITTGVFANTFGSGRGGSISFGADSLEMTTRASIEALTGWWGSGDAGNIHLDVRHLDIKDGSLVNSSTLYGWGADSGQVTVVADTIDITGPESSEEPFGRDSTGITTVTGEWGGDGGDIHIETGALNMGGRGIITASSYGAGLGGDIHVDAGDVNLLDGSSITASALSTGDGGNVNVRATNVTVSGVHPEPYTSITGDELLAPSGIGSQAGTSTGDAGAVHVTAEKVEILDGGRVTAETFGHGQGGKVAVEADDILVSGVNPVLLAFQEARGHEPDGARSMISASSNEGFLGPEITGAPGNIELRAGTLTVTDGGLVTSQTKTLGPGGDVLVRAGEVHVTDGGIVSAKSVGNLAGKGGDIHITAAGLFEGDNALVTTEAENAEGGDISITAADVDLSNGMRISAESSGEGDAGDVSFTVDNVFSMVGSTVSTEAAEADGGNINIKAGYMVHLIDSAITSSVGGGADTTGGNIFIDPEFVILQRSRIIANAYEGKGGNIKIIADCFMADPDSIVEASSALGIDGVVDIQAPINNVSGSITGLPKDFKSAVELLRQACAARARGGSYSSFIMGGRGGLPIEPGGLIPSPVF